MALASQSCGFVNRNSDPCIRVTRATLKLLKGEGSKPNTDKFSRELSS